MADIMLHTNSANLITCVPNIFIDDFMKDANGEYVKIYLFLLRCLGRDDFDFSLAEVADRLEHTEKDVMRAFTYWEKVGLLRLEYTSNNELSGICLVDVQGHDQAIKPVVTTTFTSEIKEPIISSINTVSTLNTVEPVAKASTSDSNTKPIYSPDELDAFTSMSEVEDLTFTSEYYLGRPLSTSETNSLLYWYDSLKMPTDLIQYLIEYCISNGHKSFHYMDTVARNWADDGIHTLEAAKNATRAHSSAVFSVMKALGISGRDLIDEELNYIDKWTNTYHFSIDIICDACKRTVLSTNKPSFKYADSILANWNKAGVNTLDDIAKLNEKFLQESASKLRSTPKAPSKSSTKGSPYKKENSFNKFSNREFDYDALAKKLLKQ